MNTTVSIKKVRVWDKFVRIFHWSLVACVLANFFVIDDGETAHQWLGYTASILVCARIVWGFIGSRHARFSDFFPTPAAIRQHLRDMMSGSKEHHDGHNPLGAVVMLSMLVIVLSLGATGYLQTTDAFWGEEWLEELHGIIANTLMAAVGIHAAVVLLTDRLTRSDLVRAMVLGKKRVPANIKVEDPRA